MRYVIYGQSLRRVLKNPGKKLEPWNIPYGSDSHLPQVTIDFQKRPSTLQN